jgi:hypothetical protein
MRIRLFFSAALLMLLFVGMALTQDGTDGSSTPVPLPTATWSPRAIEGIYQKLRINYDLEIENSSESFPAHEEVSSFIRLFAQEYLGVDLYMPYATQIYTGFMGYDQYHRIAASLSEPLAQGLSEYLYSVDKLPMASIGVREDGFALIYTTRCGGPACNTPQEQMKHFQGDAIGIFGMYVPEKIGSQDEAGQLISQLFPGMHHRGMLPLEGFTFGGKATYEIGGVETPLMYYVGTVPLPRHTLAFVVVGVGQQGAQLINIHP